MIYLDNAATTRPDRDAVEAALPYLQDKYFNPSALYGGGVLVQGELRRAREYLLSCVADKTRFELFFTSCGSEADNTAIFSAARRGNAVTTAGEHAAVFQSFTELRQRNVEPRFAPLRSDGRVDRDALLSLVDDKTTLVSVVHVNNETGAVNDIASIAKAVKEKNPRCLFLSDGVQAFGKLTFRLTTDIDFYAVSAHKIGGAKGTGALIRRKGVPLSPYLFGGGQEGGLRSGTENVFGILCFEAAAKKKFASLEGDFSRLKTYREQLFSALDKEIFLRISPEDGTPYILTVAAKNLRGEILQRLLEERGVLVGTGSACSSKHPVSRVITACGVGKEYLNGVLRFSFSPATTEEEIITAAEAANSAAHELIARTARS